MNPTQNLIIIFNFIILVGLVAGIRWWQKKHGILTEKRFALIFTGYFSYSFVTPLIPLLKAHLFVTLLVDAAFLLIMWAIGYPWIRWVYRQFNSPK